MMTLGQPYRRGLETLAQGHWETQSLATHSRNHDNISSNKHKQVTLNLWTFVMEGWMYAKRLPALAEYKVSTDPSFTASRMEKMLPPHLQWAAQNFNHLHEQPTYFIGTILSLTYLGINDSATVKAAWAYVGIRIVHSLVHALTNRIMVRFSLFSASSVVLLGLTARTAAVVFNLGGQRAVTL